MRASQCGRALSWRVERMYVLTCGMHVWWGWRCCAADLAVSGACRFGLLPCLVRACTTSRVPRARTTITTITIHHDHHHQWPSQPPSVRPGARQAMAFTHTGLDDSGSGKVDLEFHFAPGFAKNDDTATTMNLTGAGTQFDSNRYAHTHTHTYTRGALCAPACLRRSRFVCCGGAPPPVRPPVVLVWCWWC